MQAYDYSNYSYFGHLCEVPQDVLNNLLEYYNKIKDTKPDQNLGYYKQWHVQSSKLTQEDIDISWSHWKDDNFLNPTKDFFSKFVAHMFKFRLSYLDKDRQVAYHSKHMLPRVHIPLSDDGSIFVIKDDEGIEHEYKMDYGHAHFINVTYLHKVVATKDIDRVNSFFCFTHFVDEKLKEQFVR